MNSVNIIGHLTSDPQLDLTKRGTSITRLRVAVNGIRDNDTTYVDVKVIGKAAVACNDYLATGSKVGVQGRLAFDEWETADGDKRSRLYIVGNVDFLDYKDRHDEPADLDEADAEEQPAPAEAA